MPPGTQAPPNPEGEARMSPGEVARLFGVDLSTVRRWALAGRLSVTRTLGGQRRYYATEVYALLRESSVDREEEEN